MRDKLIELLEKKYDHYCDQCGVNKQTDYLENLADYLISHGVTFAVRCKDCKHRESLPTLPVAVFCDVWAAFNGMGDEGYCNYGERIEE